MGQDPAQSQGLDLAFSVVRHIRSTAEGGHPDSGIIWNEVGTPERREVDTERREVDTERREVDTEMRVRSLAPCRMAYLSTLRNAGGGSPQEFHPARCLDEILGSSPYATK